jgi:hypothetical protein
MPARRFECGAQQEDEEAVIQFCFVEHLCLTSKEKENGQAKYRDMLSAWLR